MHRLERVSLEAAATGAKPALAQLQLITHVNILDNPETSKARLSCAQPR
jgi:hypothetical protein